MGVCPHHSSETHATRLAPQHPHERPSGAGRRRGRCYLDCNGASLLQTVPSHCQQAVRGALRNVDPESCQKPVTVSLSSPGGDLGTESAGRAAAEWSAARFKFPEGQPATDNPSEVRDTCAGPPNNPGMAQTQLGAAHPLICSVQKQKTELTPFASGCTRWLGSHFQNVSLKSFLTSSKRGFINAMELL